MTTHKKTVKETKSYYQIGEKIYENIDYGLYSAGKEIELPKQKTPFHWKGAPIPIILWQQILSLFNDGYAKTNSENLVYLYYNTETHDWLAWAPPQTCNGMTVSADQNHKDYEAQRKEIPSDFVQLGTVHHHCKSSAFASATDVSDEQDRDGLHVTVGGLSGEKPLSIHSRATFRGETYETSLELWVCRPEWLSSAPEYMQDAIFLAILTNNQEKEEYPEIWLKNCQEHVFKEPKYGTSEWGWKQPDLNWDHAKRNISLADGSLKKNHESTQEYGMENYLKLQEILDITDEAKISEWELSEFFDEEALSAAEYDEDTRIAQDEILELINEDYDGEEITILELSSLVVWAKSKGLLA